MSGEPLAVEPKAAIFQWEETIKDLRGAQHVRIALAAVARSTHARMSHNAEGRLASAEVTPRPDAATEAEERLMGVESGSGTNPRRPAKVRHHDATASPLVNAA